MKKIAVILCGSGYLDGSEIRESVGVLWALSAIGVEAHCFAPDSPQSDVVNCLTGKPSNQESRNMLVESARIARGKVQPLTELRTSEYSGLIMPGGFGAAKNLCTFATEGSKGKVQPDLKMILESMHQLQRPIGAVCIAPAILALTFSGKHKLELTLGAHSEASAEIEKLGHLHVVKQASECHVDLKHGIVSSPAYMYDQAPLHEIFEGIQSLVREVAKLSL